MARLRNAECEERIICSANENGKKQDKQGAMELKEFKIVRMIDGKTMMATSHPECVYSDNVIRGMEKAGYKAYMDGKAYRPAKETRKAGKKTNGSDRRQSKKEIEPLFR